jgi:cytochrome c oxidase subunit 2
MKIYLNNISILKNTDDIVKLDTPTPWGLFFQDSASPQMEGIEELHNNIMFYLAIILFAVT